MPANHDHESLRRAIQGGARATTPIDMRPHFSGMAIIRPLSQDELDNLAAEDMNRIRNMLGETASKYIFSAKTPEESQRRLIEGQLKVPAEKLAKMATNQRSGIVAKSVKKLIVFKDGYEDGDETDSMKAGETYEAFDFDVDTPMPPSEVKALPSLAMKHLHNEVLIINALPANEEERRIIEEAMSSFQRQSNEHRDVDADTERTEADS